MRVSSVLTISLAIIAGLGAYPRRRWTLLLRVLSLVLLGMVAILILGTSARGVKGEVYQLKPQGDMLQVDLVVDKTETIWMNSVISEVLVGNSSVADVIPLTDKSLYVIGKKLGRTRFTILDPDKVPVGIIDINVDYDVPALETRLATFLPGSKLRATSVGGNLLLTGKVKNARDISMALSLAQQVAGKNVTNAITVTSPQQVMLEVRFVEASVRLLSGVWLMGAA
ncbi:MAG: pilus assembly protein N-terminal domain-containing protein [Rhizobiaceae bacterium]